MTTRAHVAAGTALSFALIAGCAPHHLPPPLAIGGGEPAHIPAGGREIPVAFTTTRDLPDGCRYTVRVQGTLREVEPPGAMNGGQGVYSPHVSVDPAVDCPNLIVGHFGAPRTLEGLQLTRTDLEHTLGERGEVIVPRAWRVCTAHPVFAFSAGAIQSADVSESCVSATGGAPSGFTANGPIAPAPRTRPAP